MSDPAVLKQVKIKTGILKRLIKEHAFYVAEVEKEGQRIEKLKAEAKNEDDEYLVKKAGDVLQETRGMIGNTARRCTAALADLQKLLNDSPLEECQELTDAQAQIAAAATVTTA